MFGSSGRCCGGCRAFYLQAGRLTPNILATVLAGLLLSCYATNWMGLHFIFGAFLFGVVMPRENVLGPARGNPRAP